MTPKELGEIRINRGLTRKELGEMLDISPKVILHWELSFGKPSEYYIQELKRIEREIPPLKIMTAKEIKGIRSKLGIDQQELADLVRAALWRVKRWEQGLEEPSITMTQRLSNVEERYKQKEKKRRSEQQEEILNKKTAQERLLWLTDNSLHGDWEKDPEHVAKVRQLGKQLFG